MTEARGQDIARFLKLASVVRQDYATRVPALSIDATWEILLSLYLAPDHPHQPASLQTEPDAPNAQRVMVLLKDEGLVDENKGGCLTISTQGYQLLSSYCTKISAIAWPNCAKQG